MKVTGSSKQKSVAKVKEDTASKKKAESRNMILGQIKFRRFRSGEVRSEKISRKEINSKETGRKEVSQRS